MNDYYSWALTYFKLVITPTKLEISVPWKDCDIIIPGSLDPGGAYCYL